MSRVKGWKNEELEMICLRKEDPHYTPHATTLPVAMIHHDEIPSMPQVVSQVQVCQQTTRKTPLLLPKVLRCQAHTRRQ